MVKRAVSALVIASFLGLQCCPAFADNQMGYQLVPAQEAAQLPRGGGVLGMEVGRAQQINSGGMTFELLRVNGVRPSSPGAQAGLKVGDQIIAVDGRVFPSVAAFASYIGSLRPAQQISVDYMPSGGGPQQAQRVGVTLGGSPSATAQQDTPAATGLSTGTKIAIGVGAAALFGCYKLGCFSHKPKVHGLPQAAGTQ